MLKRLNHIGIAVNNIEQAVQLYVGILGGETLGIEVFQGMKIAKIRFGDAVLELMTPLEPGPVKQFLDRRGEGLHHLCYEVDAIEPALQTLLTAGIRLIDATPRLGSEGKKIAFVHPKDTCGVLLELVEPSSPEE